MMKSAVLSRRVSQASGVLAREKAVLSFILIALCWALFYGIIVKITFDNSLLFSLKTYIPEAMMLCALLVAGIGGLLNGIGRWDILLICLLGFSFCAGLVFDNPSNAPILVRDVYIPVFFLLLSIRIDFSDDAINWFLRVLTYIMVIYVIGSLGLYYVEACNGYDWTARFYTGYSFWSQDPVSKIQINSNGRFMRLPALTGSSVKSAMYGVVALALFLSDAKINKICKSLLVVITFVCVAIFNNRASLLAAVVLIAIHLLSKASKGKGAGLFLGIVFLAICVAALFVLAFDGSFASIFDSGFARLAYWGDLLSSRGLESMLFPVNVFSASDGGAGIEGLGLSSVWDNAFLYILFAFGVPVFLLLLGFLVKQWKIVKADSRKNVLYARCKVICFYLLIATILISLTTNIFQGRSWFFIFVLVYCVVLRPAFNNKSIETSYGADVANQ